MKAVVSGSNIIVQRGGQNVCTIAADVALELATNLKAAVAKLATDQIAAQQQALNDANALLAAANAN